MANTFGALPDRMAWMVNALSKAPAPTRTSFGSDWFANLDTIAHAIGCIAGSAFDELVMDLDPEEVAALTDEDFREAIGEIPMSEAIVSAMLVAKEHYRNGSLVEQFETKALAPEGLVTQAILTPILAKGKKLKPNPQERSPLIKRLRRQDRPNQDVIV
jgi:hypothetical protein